VRVAGELVATADRRRPTAPSPSRRCRHPPLKHVSSGFGWPASSSSRRKFKKAKAVSRKHFFLIKIKKGSSFFAKFLARFTSSGAFPGYICPSFFFQKMGGFSAFSSCYSNCANKKRKKVLFNFLSGKYKYKWDYFVVCL
jgi:hypothetical protein